jgi:alpha-glucosidase
VFFHSNGARKGRDGCRVPLPWTRALPERTWLPQPRDWGAKSVEAQTSDDSSFLELYRRALALRPSGAFAWRDSPPGTLAFDRDGLTCIVHFGEDRLPVENVVLASDDERTAIWVRR